MLEANVGSRNLSRVVNFFPSQTEFVLVEMSYHLEMEILNGLISLTPNLGFGGHCNHIGVRGTLSIWGNGGEV